jgi:hypothetical protein
MRRILKYVLEGDIGTPIPVLMNKNSYILTFKVQDSAFGDLPAIWAITDTFDTDNTDLRTFILRFTGDTVLDSDLMYDEWVGTDIDKHGLVWHCFEQINNDELQVEYE